MPRFTLRRDRRGRRDGMSVFCLAGRAIAGRSLSLLEKQLDCFGKIGVEFHRRRRAAIRELHRSRVISNPEGSYAATINVAFQHLPIGAAKSGSPDALKSFSVIDSNLDWAFGVNDFDLEQNAPAELKDFAGPRLLSGDYSSNGMLKGKGSSLKSGSCSEVKCPHTSFLTYVAGTLISLTLGVAEDQLCHAGPPQQRGTGRRHTRFQSSSEHGSSGQLAAGQALRQIIEPVVHGEPPRA